MWVEKTKNGKFRLYERYVDPLTGKKKKASVMMDKNTPQAINKARPLLLDKIASKANVELLNQKDITLKELRNEFIEMKSLSRSDSTLKTYERVTKNLMNYIGSDVLINKINHKALQRYFFELADQLKISSIQLYAKCIKAMFQFAIKCNYISQNPMDNIELVSKIETQHNDEDDFLTKKEREELLKVAYQKNPRYALLIEWLLNSGMRISEAIGLQYSKIDGDIVIINEQLQQKQLTKLKTKGSVRKIQMTDTMLEIIERERLLNHPQSKNDFIFVGMSGNPITVDYFNKFLKKLSKYLSFDKHIHAHIFRHTHISMLVESNINIKSIMKRVGHTSPEITMNIYTHVTEKMNEDLANKLNDIF